MTFMKKSIVWFPCGDAAAALVLILLEKIKLLLLLEV